MKRRISRRCIRVFLLSLLMNVDVFFVCDVFFCIVCLFSSPCYWSPVFMSLQTGFSFSYCLFYVLDIIIFPIDLKADIFISSSSGRGVFAAARIPAYTVLETCPVLVLDPTENKEHIAKTELFHYT